MMKLLSRVVFGLWLVSAPMLLVGCGEDKPAAPAAAPAATPPAGGAPAAK